MSLYPPGVAARDCGDIDGIPPPPKSIYQWCAQEGQVGPDKALIDIIEVFNAKVREELMYERAVNTVNAREPFIVWTLSLCQWGGKRIPVVVHPSSMKKLYHGLRSTPIPTLCLRHVISFLKCNNWKMYCTLWRTKVYVPFYDENTE